MYCNALFPMTEYTTVHMPEFWLGIGQIDVCSVFSCAIDDSRVR